MATTSPDPRRWYALVLLCTACFMVILDSQIVILALPSIEADLGFAAGGVQWVLSAYLLSFGGLLLFGGRTADLLGRRRMFMIGTALFLLASLACGLAAAPAVLVIARVVQGVSAAIMAPTALSILMTTFTEGAERNKALGIWSGTGGFGATAALLIGGTVTDGLGWEWIFFLNIPVAAVLLALSPVLLRESLDRTGRRAFDLAGAATVTAALVLLVYAIVEAPAAGWLSVQTLGLLAGSALLVALFVRIEARSAAPLVPLRMFRSRTLVGGNVVMSLFGILAFGMSLLVSLYAQQVLGYSALVFGLGTAIMPVGAMVGAYLGQHVVTRIGVRPIAVTSMVLLTAGCLALTQVSVGGGYFGDLFLGLLIFGPGLGAGTVAASIAALTGVAERESGLASGVNTAAFQISGALGIAITSTVAASFATGSEPLGALTAGFQAGFVACVVLGVLGTVLALRLLRPSRRPADPVEVISVGSGPPAPASDPSASPVR